MYILGINAASHNSSACLVHDGMLVAFVEEERFDRVKYSTAFPEGAIRACLAEGGIGLGDVSVAAFAGVPSTEMASSAKAWLRHLHRPWYRRWLRDQVLVTGLYMGIRERKRLRGRLGFTGRITFVDHHLCHAVSAFCLSPFPEAAVLTVDAQGDGVASAIYAGEGTRLRRVESYPFPEASIGHFYDCVTEFVGFKPVRDAGKTMGLSSYGDPAAFAPKFAPLCGLLPGGRVRFAVDFLKHEPGTRSCRRFARAFGEPRRPEEDATGSRFAHVAAGAQAVLEKAFLHLAEHARRVTGAKRLCVGGGVALNSVANGLLLRSGMFEDLWIQPAANDAGLALGAAFAVWHGDLGGPRRFVMEHASFGPSFTDGEIRELLEVSKLRFEPVDDPAERAARLLAEEQIVGWFQGRMEAGPRALGNRSILACPRRGEMKDVLNRLVKHRESFRPFAPSALEERAGECFDIDRPSPFMLLVCDVRPGRRSDLGAITHVDGTARLQTVSRRANPLYHRLIDRFFGITGIPVVLNTSFNIRGEPIVCTPEHAIRCFFSTGMDDLLIGGFHVMK
ncbi:MAG: carbamoyltransferase [Planctomycetes bacterium]|jgi:carbamoyltransferase|nr:carbamoyltransferase [Planctomycetota bacterium]